MSIDSIRDEFQRADVTLFMWRLCSRVVFGVISKLFRLQVGSIEIVSLLDAPERIIGFPCDNENLIYPVVFLKKSGRYTTAMELSELDDLAENAEKPVEVYFSEDKAMRMKYRSVKTDFLGEQWEWPRLLLNLVETFGSSLDKSLDDLLLPEEYLFDCMRRNAGLNTLIDCRIFLHDLQKNGMIEEIKRAEYRLFYHAEYYAVNVNSRRETAISASIPFESFSESVRTSLHLFGRVRQTHSIEYLEYLDSLTRFQEVNFADILERKGEVRKYLIDLHSLLSCQVGVFFKVALEKERRKFYFRFRDRKVDIPILEKSILGLSERKEQESLKALFCLGWTISGDSAIDAKILTVARDVVQAKTCSLEKHAMPSLFKKTKNFFKGYEIQISPFIY